MAAWNSHILYTRVTASSASEWRCASRGSDLDPAGTDRADPVRLGRFPAKVDDSDQATNVVCANQVDGLGGRTKRRTGGGLVWSPDGKLLTAILFRFRSRVEPSTRYLFAPEQSHRHPDL